MVRIGGDSSRRSARHVRYDDIPTDTFTPRTYQVELLESAMQGNTIACLGSASSKVFLGLMVLREMSHQIRTPLEDGGKRSIYLTDTEEEVESVWSTLFHHTDMAVGRVPPCQGDQWSAEQWSSALSSNHILVLSAPTFLHCLDCGHLPLSALNLLVLDDCHKATGDHAYVGIMSHVMRCGDAAPHLLCLTAAILGSECTDPQELASRITALESTLNSKAETSMLVISERFGCRPKESVIECKADDDVTGMGDRLASILYCAWHFLEDCQVKLDDHPGKSDPLHVPKFAISECINILQTLGSWCAASIAENLISQLEKIVKHESNQTLKLFLRYTLTQLRLVVREFELGFTPDYVVDELLNYTTPKVREFIKVLRKYKPEMDFMIITREGDEDDTMSDLSDDDGNDDDSLDLSSSDEDDEKGKSSKHIHIAVKKKVERGDADSPFDDEKKLSGLVFVDNRYVAFALNKMMEEVCSWDEDLCFVKSSHITGQGIHRSDGRKDLSNTSCKQEEILRKFRMQERNLLVSTNVLEEGVDIPKCNLVVRFDPPRDYRSYTLSKGRARARDAEYVILVDEDLMEDFSDEIRIFKGIESVLIGAGRGRQDLEDAQEVQQLGQLQFTPLPTFCPLNQPGAASVSMKNAIALVNRYCAKLPSDAFTHLTPQCRVCPSPSDPDQFVAYLRLPVNSPIKEEVKGAPMPSRQLAKMAVALQMCELLYKAGELDCHLQPVGKEMFVCEEEEQWDEEEDEGVGQARPGTTKRKQYYIKKPADAFVGSRPKPGEDGFLYHVTMTLTGPITEDQNTRGRKIYAPEESTQSFGILLSTEIPNVPSFPVYTRSGEVTVSLDLLDKRHYSKEELEKLTSFHHFVFSSVLHLEKDPMVFSPEAATIGFLIVPLNRSAGAGQLDIEWRFVEEVNSKTVIQRRNVFDGNRAVFCFEQRQFEDAVVMPSYRNMDQPQHFYVAEIRTDLSPLSPFPSPELYKTFAAYYTTKYGLTLTNTEQPLLDVDHTSARLNLLTPRYMNQKGRALPTSSLETKRARRENLQQKQILVPELCDIHVFSASLWRKAVCLPAILYRMNYLLLAEELRRLIAAETGIGKVRLCAGFRFPRLDFGFETNPEKLQTLSQKGVEESGTRVDEGCPSAESEGKAEEGCAGQGIDSPEGAGRAETLVHDSSPDDDKTDTGASSDSDSGVVLSESDASCTASLTTTATLSAHIGQTAVTAAPAEGSAARDIQRRPSQETTGTADPVCSQPLRKNSSGAEKPSSESTLGQKFVSGNQEHNAKMNEVSDPFFTPSTSRSHSPRDWDSDDSVYEDAEESFSCWTATGSCPPAPLCDTDALSLLHKPSPQHHPSSSQQSALSATTQSSSSRSLASSSSSSQTGPSTLSPSFSLSLSKSSPLLPSSGLSPVSPLLAGVTGSSTHSEVLGQDEEGVQQSDVTLPQHLMHHANTCCSQKVPDHSSCLSPHRSCNGSAHLSEPGEHTFLHTCAMLSDVREADHSSTPSHSKESGSDSRALSQACKLSQETPQHVNHKQPDFRAEIATGDDHLSAHHTLEKTDEAEPEMDCDDFLDVSGSNRKEKHPESHTITFPVDPDISHFTKPGDEVQLTFESIGGVGLDANWAQTSAATTSTQEWAPNEDLTTFELNSNFTDFTDLGGESTTDVFNENPAPESKLSSESSPSQSNSFATNVSAHGNHSSAGAVHENHICSNACSEKHTCIPADSEKHTCVTADSEKHTCVAADSEKHTCVTADSEKHTCVAADSEKHTSVAADLAESMTVSREGKSSSQPIPEGEHSSFLLDEVSSKVTTDPPAGSCDAPVSVPSSDTVNADMKSVDPAPVMEGSRETGGESEKSATDGLGWGNVTARDPSEWADLLLNNRSDTCMLQDPSCSLLQDSDSCPSAASSSTNVHSPAMRASKRDEEDADEDGDRQNVNVKETDINDAASGLSDKEMCRKDNKISGEPQFSTVPKNETTKDATEKRASAVTTSTLTDSSSQPNLEGDTTTTTTEEEPPKGTSLAKDRKQFDIGTWDAGPKPAKAGGGSSVKVVEEEGRERWPLLLSLDEDQDLQTFVGPSPCLLLQALTMSNANDFFSLERLETIGDSFLKYAITVYLYCCYPGTHEGKLSYLRSKQVSNYNLYRLGRRKGLAERMVSTKFEPYENWLPPGYVISEERRRGPVPKVVIATSNPRLSAAAPVNFVIEEEESESEGEQRKETEAFHAEVEEIDRQQAVDQQQELSSSSHKQAMIPYCLQLHHGIPDKSVADCVEALIGCYLTTCGKQAALTFMSWLGLKVLPRRRGVRRRKGEEVKVTEFQELQCPPSPLLRSVEDGPAILQRLLEGFGEFEVRIDYTFRDRSYLLQAFTHASYHHNYITDCYQRLEFLGDAILDYVITRHLYEDSQRYSPGILTDLRSALVNNNIFAALAVKWDFHKFFKAISPSLFTVINKFVVRQKEREDQIDEYEEVKIPKKLETDEEEEGDEEEVAGAAVEGGGAVEKDEEVELEIPKALGDIFESVAGAIYLDSGMSLDTVWRVYYRMMKPHIDKYLKDIPKSPVRELLEMEPETAKFEKPERTLEGKIRVTVNVVGKGVFYGVGRNYRIAKSAAAKKALRFIRSMQLEGQV